MPDFQSPEEAASYGWSRFLDEDEEADRDEVEAAATRVIERRRERGGDFDVSTRAGMDRLVAATRKEMGRESELGSMCGDISDWQRQAGFAH